LVVVMHMPGLINYITATMWISGKKIWKADDCSSGNPTVMGSIMPENVNRA